MILVMEIIMALPRQLACRVNRQTWVMSPFSLSKPPKSIHGFMSTWPYPKEKIIDKTIYTKITYHRLLESTRSLSSGTMPKRHVLQPSDEALLAKESKPPQPHRPHKARLIHKILFHDLIVVPEVYAWVDRQRRCWLLVLVIQNDAQESRVWIWTNQIIHSFIMTFQHWSTM